MKLKVISSSSAGNCYLLENRDEVLVLECGVKMPLIKQALKFDLSKIVGVLITHEHNDHCCAVSDVIAAGIDVYASAGTIEAFRLKSHRLHIFATNAAGDYKTFSLGGFKIKPFDAVHDCKEPVSFLIEHEECGRVVFITDSYFCHYTFPGLNNIIIETNYSQQILDQKVAAGATSDFLRNRVLQSHMSLDTCEQFLAANDLRSVNNIVLVHLSDSNSNAQQFKQEIQQMTLKNIHVAEKGLCIDFDIMPY